MSENNYNYWVIQATPEGITEAESYGFVVNNISTDGLLAVVDKGCQCVFEWQNAATKPSYMLEDTPNWPCLDQDLASALVHYQATSQGASDGWWYDERV